MLASPAGAEPERPWTQFHVDVYMLHFFVHVITTFVGGSSWMLAAGEGWGSLPGR